MTYHVIRLDQDVYDALMELKYVYRERSMSDALAHLLHELGVEPFSDDDYDEE